MPWKEPGENDKNPDPWGNKNNNNQSPPDLDKMIAAFIKRLRGVANLKKPNGNKPSWRPSPTKKDHHYGLMATAAVLLVIWFLSGFFIVNPAEQTVLLRFGQYSDVLQPGLHWMARFIDSRYTADVQKIYSFSLEGDFLTKSAEQSDLPTQIKVDQKNPNTDQSKNLVNVELNVQYRINNLRNYLFNVVNADETVQHVAAGALSDVIGQMKLDDVLTTGREFVSSGVLERTQKILASYNAGVDVVAVTLRKVQAPDQVRGAFNDVNRADQDRSTTIQQAQAYASKVVPIAQGDAARILADANGYQQQIVLIAQANVAKYEAIAKAYANAPDITRERMYLESIQSIFNNTTKILVDSSVGNNMLYLPLDKLIKKQDENPPVSNTEPVTANSPQTHGEVKHVSN